MLKSITIKNLQAFDDSHSYTIPFTKETVLIGANNAGKSTVFNALNMVRTMILRGQFEYSNGLYNLQNFDEAVHMHDSELYRARQGSESLKTSFPEGARKTLNVKPDDELDWKEIMSGGKPAYLITKVEK